MTRNDLNARVEVLKSKIELDKNKLAKIKAELMAMSVSPTLPQLIKLLNALRTIMEEICRKNNIMGVWSLRPTLVTITYR